MGSGDAFDFNLASGVTATTSGWSWIGGSKKTAFSNGGTGNTSEFGRFSNCVSAFDGFTCAVSKLTFNLTATTGSWANAAHVLAANGDGWFAAVHIYIPNSAGSAALTTGAAAGKIDGDPPPMPTPIPPSALLTGSGLLGLGLLDWMRRRKSIF